MVSHKSVDLVVIGGGPAGLAAAIKAKEEGVEKVLVIERASELGGLLHQCIHNGFGLKYFNEDLTGPEYAHYFIEKAMDLGVEVKCDTMVVDIDSEKKITAVNNKDGLCEYQPKACILAMGCRERSRGSLNIPGTRPAGIFTAGTAQRLVNVEGYLPGKEIVILGSGDIGMIMARRLTYEGAHVHAVIEILPYPSGLIRNEVQCLYDYDIPLILNHTVINIHGMNRIKGVTIAQVDDWFKPIHGTERDIPCDTLLLSVGLIPENELSLKAGVILDPITRGPIVDNYFETNVSGIFACGNVLHVHDLVDNVSIEGEKAGFFAAQYIQGRFKRERRRIRVKGEGNVRYVLPQYISGEEEVTLFMRVKEPNKKSILTVGDGLYKKKLPIVKPSEMISVKITKEILGKMDKEENQFLVKISP